VCFQVFFFQSNSSAFDLRFRLISFFFLSLRAAFKGPLNGGGGAIAETIK